MPWRISSLTPLSQDTIAKRPSRWKVVSEERDNGSSVARMYLLLQIRPHLSGSELITYTNPVDLNDDVTESPRPTTPRRKTMPIHLNLSHLPAETRLSVVLCNFEYNNEDDQDSIHESESDQAFQQASTRRPRCALRFLAFLESTKRGRDSQHECCSS